MSVVVVVVVVVVVAVVIVVYRLGIRVAGDGTPMHSLAQTQRER